MAINTNNQDLQNTTFDKIVGSEPQVLDFPVDSVNGKTGDVVLDIEDIGNLQGELDTIGLEIDSVENRLDVIENKEEPVSVVTSVNGLVDNVELDGDNIFSDTRTINVRFLDVENSIDSIANSLENPERVLKVLGKIDLATAQDLIGTEDATLTGGEVYIVIDDVRPLEFEVLLYDNKWLYLNTPITLPSEIELNRLVVSSIGSIATLTIEKDVTGQNASFLNIYNKTEVNGLLTDFESELDVTFEEIEQRLNNIENTGIGVRSFNGKTGDLVEDSSTLKHFENSTIFNEIEDIKANMTVGGSDLLLYTEQGFAEFSPNTNGLVEFTNPFTNNTEEQYGTYFDQIIENGEKLFRIDLDGSINILKNCSITLDVARNDATADNTSHASWVILNNVYTYVSPGQYYSKSFSVTMKCKAGDVVRVLRRTENYSKIWESVIRVTAFSTSETFEQPVKEQDYTVTFVGSVVGDGTWQSVPLTYVNGNGNNVYDPDYFASINSNGDIELPSNFSVKCNKVGTTGTAYISAASNDVLMRVLLSPPNADDITLNKNQLTSSIILGESISVKSATQDLINLACRDMVSKLSDGTLRDDYVLRVQFKSTSDFVVENDPKNNTIDFVVYPL